MSILNSYLVTSQLLRPFDPLKDYSGRGQYLAVTKDDLNPAKTRSKIGHHRVRKGEVFGLSFFCVL